MENVEKQLRTLASETHTMTNNLRRRVGPFRLRPKFVVHSYYGEKSNASKAFARSEFDLDLLGVAACYQTVGALGIHKTAEVKKNAGWLPWWVLPLAGVGVCFGIVLAFAALPALGGAAAKSVVTSTAGGAQKALGGPSVDVSSGPKNQFRDAFSGSSGQSGGKVPEPVRIEFVTVKGAAFRMGLSDGRVITESDRQVKAINGTSVDMVDGSRLYYARPKPRPVEPARAAQSTAQRTDINTGALRQVEEGEGSRPLGGSPSGTTPTASFAPSPEIGATSFTRSSSKPRVANGRP